MTSGEKRQSDHQQKTLRSCSPLKVENGFGYTRNKNANSAKM